MISETSKDSTRAMMYMNSISKSSKKGSSQFAEESEAEKLDLRVELLLQHLKQDLKLLKRKHKSLESIEFKK